MTITSALRRVANTAFLAAARILTSLKHGLWPESLRRLVCDRDGGFGVMGGMTMLFVVIAVGASIDINSAMSEREKMQRALDAGVLAAVKKTALADQRTEIQNVFLANFSDSPVDFDRDLAVSQNADKSITARLSLTSKTMFMGIIGKSRLTLAVKSSALAVAGSDSTGPCIYVLGSSGQDVLVNSGANWQSTKCSFDVHSTANNAFMMNSGATISFTEFCVKGTRYTKNGGTLSNLKTACAVHADPYVGQLPEPTVPSACTTSGYFNANSVTLDPGVHCGTGFNGSPTITFKPGLHIIKNRMTINSGATVIATDVTFYFPDTNSEIRANGNLTLKASAPTSGIYKGILMFEKTSDATNNSRKTQYIFNGSTGESLEGIIYLPNRNVTYNSTSNVAAKISMVVNQMILNSSNWVVEPYAGLGSTTQAAGARLTE